MIHKLSTHPRAVAIGLIVGVLVFVGVTGWAGQHATSLQAITTDAGMYGVISYIAFLALSIVVAPLGTGFLLPIAATSFGPFLAAIYSIVGWTLGAVLAFSTVRYLRYTFFSQATFLVRIIAAEKTIPRWHFYTLVILFRMSLPVDVVSYALALATSISLRMFLITTMIGITPTTFLFSYASQGTSGVRWLVALVGAIIFVAGLLLAKSVLGPHQPVISPQ